MRQKEEETRTKEAITHRELATDEGKQTESESGFCFWLEFHHHLCHRLGLENEQVTWWHRAPGCGYDEPRQRHGLRHRGHVTEKGVGWPCVGLPCVGWPCGPSTDEREIGIGTGVCEEMESVDDEANEIETESRGGGRRNCHHEHAFRRSTCGLLWQRPLECPYRLGPSRQGPAVRPERLGSQRTR